jgi:hypothetical protein
MPLHGVAIVCLFDVCSGTPRANLVVPLTPPIRVDPLLSSATVLAVWLEPCVPQRLLEAPGVDGSTGNLEIDLHVDVHRPGVSEAAARAEQLGDEPAQDDELGAGAVVVNDPDERALGGFTRGSAARDSSGTDALPQMLRGLLSPNPGPPEAPHTRGQGATRSPPTSEASSRTARKGRSVSRPPSMGRRSAAVATASSRGMLSASTCTSAVVTAVR